MPPLPKDTLSRPRDQARRDATWTKLAADEQVRGPELPDGLEWPPETLKWWQTWRESAQAQTFTAVDWSYLTDTAVLHAAFWSGDRSVAPELRLRVAKFGATPVDRLRLRMTVTEPQAPTALANPDRPADRRKNAYLLRAVQES